MKHSSFFLMTLVLCVPSAIHSQESNPLVLSQTVSLPNVQGGFNHMSVDAGRLRLFAAAPTNTTLEIIDLKEGKPWRTLTGDKPAAVRYAPEFDQLYVARGQSLYIYDGKTYDVITSIDLGSNLDELQYDARARRLYVGCMSADKTGIAVISIPDGKLLGKIVLPDRPQGFAVEHRGNRIFANMPDLRQVAVMDGEKRVILTTWQLDPGLANVPMGLDEANHRLFIGTRHPEQLVVLDTSAGKVVAKIETNSDADDLFYGHPAETHKLTRFLARQSKSLEVIQTTAAAILSSPVCSHLISDMAGTKVWTEKPPVKLLSPQVVGIGFCLSALSLLDGACTRSSHRAPLGLCSVSSIGHCFFS